MNDSSPHFVGDISLINSIEAVPTILQVICNATGMGFAAVARVREGRWVACSVVDQIDVGLRPGFELPVENVMYDEIRTPRQEVVIDRAVEIRYGASHSRSLWHQELYFDADHSSGWVTVWSPLRQ